jgi:putative acetyltransferase
VSQPPLTLRRYSAADEDAAIALWRRTWAVAYPEIDFDARLAWWRKRWQDEMTPTAAIVVAEAAAGMIGFVTIDPKTGYLDQLVVAPEAWGGGVAGRLMDEAKRIAPGALFLYVNRDNARAVRFYTKHGFTVTENSVNPLSGRPTYLMRWNAEPPTA